MQNTAIIQEIQNIGMPPKVATVYATVLEMGVAYPSKIAEQTTLNRSTVYKILSDLTQRGLVTELERNKKLCYQVEAPEKLIRFTKNQIQAAEERAERAKKLLPELEGLFALTPNKPRVRFFEGLDGVLAVYEEHITQKEPYEMVAYSNVEELMKLLPPAFVERYVNAKEKQGIATRAIFPDTAFSKNYNKELYAGVEKKIQVERKFVPAETFPFNAEITMYGKQSVSIINFQENVLIGVIIEDPTIAGMMRMVFELAWSGVKG